MIASALMAVDRKDVLFSASGLSNLQGADPVARAREQNLLKEQIALHPEKLFVYVSSYSIDDNHLENNSPYLAHKRSMEILIKEAARHYLIVRTSNVVGHSRQPGNLMNFIFRHLKSGSPFEIWTHTSRNLIDVSDLARMIGAVVELGACDEVLYLTHPADIAIYDIVRQFEMRSGLRGNYQLVDKGVFYQSDKAIAERLFKQLGLESDPGHYAGQLIEKYFGSQFRSF